jgi:hypothetical protein
MLFRNVAVRNWQDLASGLLFVGIGLAALAIGWNYPMGTATRMGPGYLPFVLSGLLSVLGLAIIATNLTFMPRKTREPSGQLSLRREVGAALRPMLFVSAALVTFAFLLPRMGLVVAVSTLVVLSAFADTRVRPVLTVILAVALSTLAVLIFVRGLGIPIRTWP